MMATPAPIKIEKIRILLLEDNAVQAKTIMDLLHQFPNEQFEVVWAERISNALDKLRQSEHFHVILADLITPDTRNLQAVERLSDQVPHLPLIAMVESEKDASLGQRAIQSGAQNYIQKEGADSSLFARVIRYAIQLKSLDKQIQELAEIKSKLIEVITRKFLTPLTVMEHGIKMMSAETEPLLNEKQKSHLQLVESNTNYLMRLANDLLDFQKLETDRKGLVVQIVNMYELIFETIQRLKVFATRKGLEVKCDLAGQIPRIVCDRAKIGQVLGHLINNAIKFTERPTGQIVITSEEKNNFLRISIRDQGPGIKPEDQPQLFQMFSQLSDDEKKSDGAGLGLFVSMKIMEAHEGRIGVESEPGKGSVFYFELPLKKDMRDNLKFDLD